MCRFATTSTLTSLLSFGFGQNSASSPADGDARVETLHTHLTLQEKIDMLDGVDDVYIRGNKKIGLPCLKMADGPVGVHTCGPAATLGGIGLAPTWDPDLVDRLGVVIGQDARARGVHFMLGPGVNIYRTPQCNGNFSERSLGKLSSMSRRLSEAKYFLRRREDVSTIYATRLPNRFCVECGSISQHF